MNTNIKYYIKGFLVGIVLLILGGLIAIPGDGSYLILYVCFAPVIAFSYLTKGIAPLLIIIAFPLYAGIIGYAIGTRRPLFGAIIIATNYISLIFMYCVYSKLELLGSWNKLCEEFSFSWIHKAIIILSAVIYLAIHIKLWLIVMGPAKGEIRDLLTDP